MSEPIIIFGQSGSGKSTSLENFAEDEIFYVNCIGKRLPFKNKFKYSMQTDNINTIITALNRMPTNIAVIDDATFIMTNNFMKGHSAPKAGSSAFDLYNDIADSMWKLFEAIRALPDNKLVYLILHEDITDNNRVKIRTIGRLLDEKIGLESMVTVCLRCKVEGTEHFFQTQSTGLDISKSPRGMFDNIRIPNDLKEVDTKIREFYGLVEERKETTNESVSD